MINYLDMLELQLQVIQLSDNIPDNLISNIINDDQFEIYNYDYDIMYIFESAIFNRRIDINNNFNKLEEWSNNLTSQIGRLSQHNYSNDELLIFKKLLYYKLILNNSTGDIMVNKKLITNFIQDIIEVLSSINISEETSCWLAKEKLRLVLLEIYSKNIDMLTSNPKMVSEQLNIARANEKKVKELFNIIIGIKITR